jgi:tetratricopeptide (TPR) repeat protein
MAGLRDPRGAARWRVFISHTVELRDFPRAKSYVSEVERAISAAGHVIVDMADLPAADQPPAQVCAERVRGCDVFLGLLGTRYGTPVRDRPHMSYTELEFDAATEAGLDRLVFLLDPDAESVGIPPSRLIDREFGNRQDAFRRRVQDSGLLTQSFADPATLGRLVERSLRELAETRQRIDSGIQREQIPAEPQAVRASKFVNPPPAIAPTWFQDRQVETGLLARYVTDPGIRIVSVSGRGGIGKTAMVCRLLKGLEGGRIPDVAGDAGAVTAGGIVYLSRNGVHQVEYPTLVADLLRLLPSGAAQPLQRIYQDPHHTPAKMMLALLEAFPAGGPVVVLLDNLESVMDPERETLTEQSLHEALSTVLTAPAHAVTVIATTRVPPTALLKLEPARQRQLRLEEGLGSPDAETVLRELDDDGRLGLRDAPDELLDGLREHTRGFPRALEAVKAILDGDATLTPQDLLDRTRHLPEDQVVQVLVKEAYDLLDRSAQLVMQALSVYPTPVSEVGVDFLLRPNNPTTDAAPILTRLVGRQLVRFQDRHYHLHPLDREYARSQLPPGSPGDPPAAFTLTGLQARAADYYTQIRTPRESWRTLEDIRPQLAEFELRCNTGDYDTAATVLNDIDFDYLQVWGHYRTVVDLHGRIHGQIANPALNGAHLTGLGLCHTTLGDYRLAIDLHTEALAVDRDTGDRQAESADLSNLAACHTFLGDYRQAIDLFTEALGIARDTGNRRDEGLCLSNLGVCQTRVGDYRQAIDLTIQALGIARDTDNRREEGEEGTALGNLGNCHHRLGDYRQAIDLFTEALGIARDTGNRRDEGYDLGYFGNCHHDLGDYRQAIDLHTQSLAIAREIGDRHGETRALDYLGRAWLASGDARRAVPLLEEAVSVADATVDFEPAVKARSGLARALLQLGDPAAALAATGARPKVLCPPEEPTIRLLEGLALLGLDRVQEGVRAFSGALAAADALLALADRNVAAVHTRALALAGLAAATGDPARATATAEAFARAHTITSAAGVAADTHRLLDTIASHDLSGVLAVARAGQDL